MLCGRVGACSWYASYSFLYCVCLAIRMMFKKYIGSVYGGLSESGLYVFRNIAQ